jgi:plastocyanin
MSAHLPSPARRRISRAAGLLAALLMAVSAVMLAAAPAEATSHTVTIKQYAYGPGSLTVKQGDTVTWTNQDTAAHDVVVTSGPVSFRSPMLDQGESWSHTFTTPGAYSYICSVHPDMKGTVTAVAKAVAPATTAPTHSHSQAPAPPASSGGTGPVSSSGAAPKASRKPSAKAIVSAAPGVPATSQPTAAVQQPTTTLNPLLLVAGASIAVVVFCLLLMASRPPVREAVPADDPDPS